MDAWGLRIIFFHFDGSKLDRPQGLFAFSYTMPFPCGEVCIGWRGVLDGYKAEVYMLSRCARLPVVIPIPGEN